MMSTTEMTELKCPVELQPSEDSVGLNPLIEKYELALLMLLGFAGFSALIGVGYNAIRRYIFHDHHKFDVIFDAGGRVSLSLTTVTATSQLIWPADFLQSPTIASKVGIGGSLWYTMAIVLSVLVFAVLCMQLKSRAPGAKTFPQIAYARFGRPAHILFCVAALFTNLVIIANLILAGKTTIQVLSKDSSNEFVCLLMAVLFGSYCLIGGLGTTFYISYFNTCLIFISASFFILKTSYFATDAVSNFTSFDAIYEATSCLKGPEGNYADSYLTFRSENGIISGVVLLFMTIAIMFCDQANWQSKIAAKPAEGVVGFLLAGFLWFAIPTSVSYMSTLTYKTMSFKHGGNLLTDAEIDEGFITPYVVQELLGKDGVYLLLTLVTMALMSTGSGEVMSISSILVYDVYKTHIRPFRESAGPTDCVLCGNAKYPGKEDIALCSCQSVEKCDDCADDIKRKLSDKVTYGLQYKCQVHGQYRHYEDQLIQYKSWAMIWVVIGIVPFGLLIIESGMNLNWAFMAAQVFIAPFLIPLYFTIGWARATGPGLIAGSVIGVVCGVTGMLAYASTYEGGLSDFYTNTAKEYSILTGLLSGCFASIIISVAVSLMCSSQKQRSSPSKLSDNKSHLNGNKDNYDLTISINDTEVEWQKTMSIDNPLNPYRSLYKHELEAIGVDNKLLTTHHMERIFRRAKIISGILAAISFTIFLVIIPIFALSQTVLSQLQMTAWISVVQHWCLIATVLVVFVPPVQEGWQIWRQYKTNTADKNVPSQDTHSNSTHI